MTNEQTSKTPEAPAFADELKPGTTLLQGQYTIERFINSGGFGITYLARDSLDRKVVIKECFPSSMCFRKSNTVQVRSRSHRREFTSIVRLFGQEARSLAKLQHPNIVGVHQVFEDNDTAYMALDFVEARDLLTLIEEDDKRFSPEEIKAIILKLLDAVSYIHDSGMLHRDISPDNILLDRMNNPILIDFGAAREEASRKSRILSSLHTVKDGYSPQEFYIAGSTQTPSSDIYALAATFYHMIVGEPPPNSQARVAAIAENRRDPYRPITVGITGYDDYFIEALNKALAIFPKDRLQSAQEWIDEIDWEKRKKAAKQRAMQDKMMEESIFKIVSETNKAVKQDTVQEAKAEKRARRRGEPAIEETPRPRGGAAVQQALRQSPPKPKAKRRVKPGAEALLEADPAAAAELAPTRRRSLFNWGSFLPWRRSGTSGSRGMIKR
jgi:serine/threonine protein kinase